jgi:hypothetical protein
MEAY